MKKRSIVVLLAVALTIGNAVPATAAMCRHGRNPQCGQNYEDADGDGVCDNFADADGDGINDNCLGNEKKQGQGQCKAVTADSAKKNNERKAGAKKGIIKKVQKKLNKIGFNCGKANGTMNAKTKKALKKFKRTKGLKANSLIDSKTLAALSISK